MGAISILVIDIGSSAVRTSVVRPDGAVDARRQLALSPDRPMPGLVEQDGAALGSAVMEAARSTLDEVGAVTGVGVTNQRGTTIVWDAGTSEPIGPALSWQDLRTAGTCLELQAEGLRLAPNESATKLGWLLDTYDPARSRDLRFGTLDTWVTWLLTEGRAHITDPSNAAVTGLLPTEAVLAGQSGLVWDQERLDRFRVPGKCMPTLVASSGAARGGHCPHRRPTHLQHGRGPASLAHGPGVRPPRRRQGHLRYRRLPGRQYRRLPASVWSVRQER